MHVPQKGEACWSRRPGKHVRWHYLQEFSDLSFMFNEGSPRERVAPCSLNQGLGPWDFSQKVCEGGVTFASSAATLRVFS